MRNWNIWPCIGKGSYSISFIVTALNLAYVKRFKSPKFILDKEYHLFTPHTRSRILLLLTGEDKHSRVSLVPSRRAEKQHCRNRFQRIPRQGGLRKRQARFPEGCPEGGGINRASYDQRTGERRSSGIGDDAVEQDEAATREAPVEQPGVESDGEKTNLPDTNTD